MRVATICGSLRRESYNRKLRALADDSLRAAGVEVDSLDLLHLPLPMFNQDDEDANGLPDHAWTLKARLAACHGILIVSPEYNGGVPGGLKNALDWTSRGEGNPWQGKVVALMGATPGQWGTWRMMPHLRQSLQTLGAIVIPEQLNVPRAGQVWDSEGKLLDDKLPARLDKVLQRLTDVTAQIAGERLRGE